MNTTSHAVRLKSSKYQSEASHTYFGVQNCISIKNYTYFHLHFFLARLMNRALVSMKIGLLKAPWLEPQEKISKSDCLLCFKWPLQNVFLHKNAV